MPNPKISICIPTYNRANYLRWQLSFFKKHQNEVIDWEFIISDNCSEDDTENTAEDFKSVLNIKYFKQAENIGPVKNIQFAYSKSSATYAVYLADDDILSVENVNKYAEFLNQHTQVSALFSPWNLIDGVTENFMGQFYSHNQDEIILKGDYSSCTNFILEHKIFPEIFIVRTDIVKSRANDHPFVHIFFAWLQQCIKQGDVIFTKTPFYNSITRHPMDEGNGRNQLGNEEVQTAWDRYRGGMELLIGAARDQQIEINVELFSKWYTKVHEIIQERMFVGLRLNLLAGKFIDSYWLYMRLRSYGTSCDTLIGYEDMLGLATLEHIIKNYPYGMYFYLDDAIPGSVRKLAIEQINNNLLITLNQSQASTITISINEFEEQKKYLSLL